MIAKIVSAESSPRKRGCFLDELKEEKRTKVFPA